MRLSIVLALILAFLTSCSESPEQKTTKNKPKVERQVIELSYIKDVKVTDILNVINKHQLRVHEKNAPSEVKVSETLIMKQNFFQDFYRKKDGNYECDISISGLGDRLGSVSVVVRNFKQNRDKSKMERKFNNLVNSLPQKLFIATLKGPNWVESFSKNFKPSNMKGLFSEVLNGIEYRFFILDSEITLDIAKEGN